MGYPGRAGGQRLHNAGGEARCYQNGGGMEAMNELGNVELMGHGRQRH